MAEGQLTQEQGRWKQMAEQFAVQVGLDPAFFTRLIWVESKFNPSAYNQKSGATGIAQIVPKWHPNVNPKDPVASLKYAARWLKELYDQYGGNYIRAAAAYNWGPVGVNAWDGDPKKLPSETQDYLELIFGDWNEDDAAPGGSPSAGSGFLGFSPQEIGEGLAHGIWSQFLGGFRSAFGWDDPRDLVWGMTLGGIGAVCIYVGLRGLTNYVPSPQTIVKMATGGPAAAAAQFVAEAAAPATPAAPAAAPAVETPVRIVVPGQGRTRPT